MTGHVALVGLMGSGKTTIGRRVAGLLQRDFFDADDAVVEVCDRSIPEIFAAEGEAGFRAVEADVLEELLEHHRPAVIATGGGVVLSEANRRRLRAPTVTVVWLDAGPAFLARRVEGRTHRPLLQGPEDPATVLARLHAARAPLYAEVADIVVDVEPRRDPARSKQQLAEQVAAAVIAHEGAAGEAS